MHCDVLFFVVSINIETHADLMEQYYYRRNKQRGGGDNFNFELHAIFNNSLLPIKQLSHSRMTGDHGGCDWVFQDHYVNKEDEGGKLWRSQNVRC